MAKNYYIHSLSTYRKPFKGGFHKNTIKEACLERIQLHSLLTEDSVWEPWTTKWISLVKDRILNSCVHLKNLLTDPTEEDLAMDFLSFWYILLTYSKRNRECQKYFIEREMEWFRLRYLHSTEEQRDKFCTNCSKIAVIDDSQKEILKERLMHTEPELEGNFEKIQCFQVHWTECALMISNRTLLLVEGIAYFSENQLIEVLTCYLAKIWWNLLYLNRNCDDSRVVMLTNAFPMPKIGIITNYTIFNEITVDNINEQALRFFPPCSLYLHLRLRKDHHLKYDCKMQLGVFLHTIGLPYTDALAYWKSEFTMVIATDLYNRKYEYLFKHQYGTVGRKSPYKQYSCNDLLAMKVGAMQLHGCPYKTFDIGKLRNLLNRVLSLKESHRVVQLVEKTKYKEACTMVYNFLHSKKLENEIEAPHEYYFNSNQCGGCSRSCSSIGMDW